MLDNVPGARERAEAGELAFGTVDTWLIWKLTGGASTSPTSATPRARCSSTCTPARWDDELLGCSASRAAMLPEVRASSEVYGEITVPGSCAACRSAGSPATSRRRCSARCASTPGLAKNTYGTGCFMLHEHRRRSRSMSRQRLLTTVAWQIGGQTEYALEGSVFIGGAVVQWLRDGLRLIRSRSDVEALAASVPDNGGVYFVPAFAGLGAPHWDPYARGTIVGLTRGHDRRRTSPAPRWKASLFRSPTCSDAMQSDAGIAVTELRVDGGAAQNNLLHAIPGRLARRARRAPGVTETTALGAAYLAGLAVGFWKSAPEIASQWRVERRFEPQMPRDRRRNCAGNGLAPWTAREGLGRASRARRNERGMNRKCSLARVGAQNAVGLHRHRRRRDRRGRGRRCRVARLRGPAARAERFRQRHVEPQHEARARRRALSRAGQLPLVHGSAQGARAAPAKRAASRAATCRSSFPTTRGGRRRSTASASSSTTCSPANTASARRSCSRAKKRCGTCRTSRPTACAAA